ncbi:MAG: ParB/RepB/Spo0J family partition protein [Chloroflexi bacterium]|nr:ParB/RepB/Spo0J family partition protein [Chloroflexota bacterium]
MTTMTVRERQQVDLRLLDDNPWQPRQDLDPDALSELAGSIKRLGLMQAPLARPHPEVSGRYQIAFGHRRVAALRLLRAEVAWPDHVEIDVAGISDEDMAVMALAENDRRRDLTDIERVRAYRRAVDETELTPTTLAEQLDIHISTLSNHLRTLELPASVLEHVESGALSLGVAREFLALQGPDCVHEDEMQDVIRKIVNVENYNDGGRADWRRRNVRKMISETVSFVENRSFRPIGPRTGHEIGRGNGEPTFDVDAFSAAHPHRLHTIPADDGASENYRLLERYEKSRVWTCHVREWSRWQSRDTRERNRAIEAHGDGSGGRPPEKKDTSNVRLLEQLLGKDPVWTRIAAARPQPGPDRPVTDEEKELLGTRATFHQVGYDSALFYKILNKGDRTEVHRWEDDNGGFVPPFFDLEECQDCVIGAAYGGSQHGYPMHKPALACFNREHYQEKLAAASAEYRAKLDSQITGAERQDMRTVRALVRTLDALPDDARRALALAMITARGIFEWEHPFVRGSEWSYEPGTVARIREILGDRVAGRWDGSKRSGLQNNRAAATVLDDVDPQDLRELIGLLATYHLRQAGQVDLDFSREKSQGASEPEPPAPTGDDSGAETRRCTACNRDKPIADFGRQLRKGPDGEYYDVRWMCKACTAERQKQRRQNQTPIGAAS